MLCSGGIHQLNGNGDAVPAVNIIGAFQSGGKLISTLYGSSGYLNLLTGRRGNVDVDYWTPENKGAEFPRPGGIQSGDNQKYASTLGLFDGGYLKIRNITLLHYFYISLCVYIVDFEVFSFNR